MTNLWTLDLNIEFQEPIKQRCLPVQTAIKYLGRRLPFGSRLQQPEPAQWSENASLHGAGTKVPLRLQTPITGEAQSRVSVSLGSQSWADAESDHRMTPTPN